jgi:signal transduction histidine kinase
VDIGRLVAGLVERADTLRERTVEMDTRPCVANVDATKVERMVENLLGNAARHTPPEARIWVGVHGTDGGVLVVVEDEGPGVPDELKREVFEPFRRGPAAASLPGSGIGLSLVARFAELQGGRAWVEDRPGGGASFRVFLPTEPTL